VFVHFAFRVNLPPDNALLRTFDDVGDAFHKGSTGSEVDLPVLDEEVVVLKRRASALAGTDLDLVLRARSVNPLAIAGVANPFSQAGESTSCRARAGMDGRNDPAVRIRG